MMQLAPITREYLRAFYTSICTFPSIAFHFSEYPVTGPNNADNEILSQLEAALTTAKSIVLTEDPSSKALVDKVESMFAEPPHKMDANVCIVMWSYTSQAYL